MRVSCATALTWMRHLLTSLAQRALLQPEVRDSPERKRRRRAAAAAGRIVWPGLILTAHQRGTGNTYINTTHRTGTQRANKHKFHLQHSNKGGGSRAGTRCSEGPKLGPNHVLSGISFSMQVSSWPSQKPISRKQRF